jgi:putative flippase GtrA
LATKVARALSVSAFTTALSAGVLVALTGIVGVAAALANVIATLVGIGPSYVLNRRWVWRRGGPHSTSREVAPFVALSIAGLVLSTIAVARVADIGRSWPTAVRTIALPVANVGTFAALWVAQFFVLDRFLFRTPPALAAAPPDDGSGPAVVAVVDEPPPFAPRPVDARPKELVR